MYSGKEFTVYPNKSINQTNGDIGRTGTRQWTGGHSALEHGDMAGCTILTWKGQSKHVQLTEGP